MRIPSRPILRPAAVLAALACLLAMGSTAAEETDPNAEPLVLTPENTVILNGMRARGWMIQYYLIKGYVGDEAAEPYHHQNKAAERSAAPAFPLLDERKALPLPEGKNIISLGNTRFLSAEDKERLRGAPNSILFRRQGPVLVVGGDHGHTRFLNEIAGVRLYAPEELWLSRPRTKEMVIRRLDTFYQPTLSIQPATGYEKRFRDWMALNRPVYMSMYAPHNEECFIWSGGRAAGKLADGGAVRGKSELRAAVTKPFQIKLR